MQDKIREAVVHVMQELGVENAPSFAVEHPADMSHGDYAVNVAMVLAKTLSTNPRALAEQISEKLSGKISEVEKIDIAGPGFINLYLKRSFFVEQIQQALSADELWGKNSVLEGEQVLFEYTSPNLFKPLHVGNLVGNIVGESVARLYAFAGANVVRINYPSDIGLTVAKGVWGLRAQNTNPDSISALGEAYRFGNAEYENNPEAKLEIQAVNRALYAGDDTELLELRRRGLETSKVSLNKICALLGTSFDTVIYESEASPVGVAIVTDRLAKGVFEMSDGAIIYRGEKHGLHTRVFMNSQGLPTYEAKDIGNFALKTQAYPDWSRMVVVTGGEQREYFKVIIAAMKEVFPEAADKIITHIPTGFLTLTTGKMSSRLGNVLTGEDILNNLRESALSRAEESRADDVRALADNIAVAALKYQILRQSIGSDMVFDKEKALSFEGASGPYLQYTYARTVSVLTKAKDAGILLSDTVVPDVPYVLERMLYQFTEVVASAVRDNSPHVLITYLTELSAAFNTFYAHEMIADSADKYAPYKATITDAVRLTLQQGLYILAIHAPVKM